MDPQLLARLCKVRRLARRTTFAGERAAAENRLEALLVRHGLSQADLDEYENPRPKPPPPPPPPPPDAAQGIEVIQIRVGGVVIVVQRPLRPRQPQRPDPNAGHHCTATKETACPCCRKRA